MAFSYILEGNHAAIIECLEKALQISSDPFYSQFVKLCLGNVYTASGQYGKAEDLLNEVMTYTQTFGCEIWEQLIIPDLEKIRQSKKSVS